ncbi:MAG: D-aminoacyl-tRNA deacylase [Gammaproteobacteria bacterium]|nr:D-aminoacyl-tRNA deacylase [Gammaproteobacteria bacterium]
MIGLLQRVSQAQVVVDGVTIAGIAKGLLVLVGVQRGDGAVQADRLLERLLAYRVFPDTEDRMNLSVQDVQGGLLLVPQFTLAADTRTGNRAGFSSAAQPQEARRWFEYLVLQARLRYARVQAGSFGADMQVGLVNDGPVTFWLEVPPPAHPASLSGFSQTNAGPGGRDG